MEICVNIKSLTVLLQYKHQIYCLICEIIQQGSTKHGKSKTVGCFGAGTLGTHTEMGVPLYQNSLNTLEMHWSAILKLSTHCPNKLQNIL